MNVFYLLSGIITCGLLLYLFIMLFKPELF